MTTLPHPGATDRPRTAIPTSAFTHRRSRVAGGGLTLQVVRPMLGVGGVLGVVDEPGVHDGVVQLVVTSRGLLATHSVWHDHGLDRGEVRELAAEARDDVRRADELLVELGLALAVLPVVVVWGPDEAAVTPGGRVQHDVLFVRGGELAAVLRAYLARATTFTRDDAGDLAGRLDVRRAGAAAVS